MRSPEQKRDISNLKKELIRILDAAAMYNEKGYIWSGHSPDKRAKTEASFHEAMLDLLSQIGPGVLEPVLEKAIVSGDAARDDFGHFSEIARRN